METAVLPSQMEMTRNLETSRVASTAILLIKSCNSRTSKLHTIFHSFRSSFTRFYPTWVGVSRKTPRLPNDNKKAEGQTETLRSLHPLAIYYADIKPGLPPFCPPSCSLKDPI